MEKILRRSQFATIPEMFQDPTISEALPDIILEQSKTARLLEAFPASGIPEALLEAIKEQSQLAATQGMCLQIL